MKQLITLIALVLFVGVAGVAQQPPAQPAPGRSDGILGPQLIAWSELQKPQPVPQQPQPVPAPDTKSGEQPSSAAQDQPSQNQGKQNEQQPEPETQQTTSQSVSGTVVKVGGKYVLETSDNLAYQLDDQEKAKQYEGRHVKVMGTLDRSTGIIHVRSIELLS
jgi:hypothetical protein